MKINLTIELVPKTSWFSNLRSELSKSDWDKLRKRVYEKAGHKCEVCGGKGKKWPLECHEIWEYDDENKIQTLSGLIALCPKCHEVKHIGLAQIKGRGHAALKHLSKVNGWSESDASLYIEAQFETWSGRSQFDWEINLKWLEENL